jgi:hypothetical protein
MALELLDMAERRWRRVNAPQRVPLVWAGAGVRFLDGLEMERDPRRRTAA